ARYGQQHPGAAPRRLRHTLVPERRQARMSVYQQAPTPGRIDGRQLSIRLGQGRKAFEAVQRLDFAIEPGEFVCILGPSGCGKSTLLGALAGHLQLSGGSLLVDGTRSEEHTSELQSRENLVCRL